MKPPAFVDWLFRDRRTGAITIAQTPNPPLWIFIGTVALRLVVPAGSWRTALTAIGLVALGWWAADEVLRGVNPWRRLLGTVGLVIVAGGVVRLLA